MRLAYIILFALLMIESSGCKKGGKAPKEDQSGPTYFSVIQFADDQFRTYWGQPFTMLKIVYENGKTDSSFVAAKDVDWAKELAPFFRSDISKPGFLGQYNFSLLNDDATVSKIYYYEAINKDLFTRNLQIITDPFTDKVKTIYIETSENGKLQKLYYTPLKVIQIQEFESSMIGGSENKRIEYRFLY